MAIEKLGSERLSAFLAFCRAHRTDVDDSFLYDEDLRNFVASDEDPTYLALADGGRIVGAASIMNSAYYRRGRKGRFRIFSYKTPIRPFTRTSWVESPRIRQDSMRFTSSFRRTMERWQRFSMRFISRLSDPPV